MAERLPTPHFSENILYVMERFSCGHHTAVRILIDCATRVGEDPHRWLLTRKAEHYAFNCN